MGLYALYTHIAGFPLDWPPESKASLHLLFHKPLIPNT